MTDNMTSSGIARALSESMPVERVVFESSTHVSGLVIVDEVNGFATVGGGNLAPRAHDEQVARMVDETNRLAHAFSDAGRALLAFLDTHEPGKPEPPYPPHCERGTGEEELVPALAWLTHDPNTTLVRKDCINGFIGAIGTDGTNRVVEWVNEQRIEALLVVGICTDICVMDFVLTMLSARNHDMMPSLRDIAVYEHGCATYDLPMQSALAAGLAPSASHPQDVTHYMGLYFMASRGAQIADRVAV